MLVRIEIFTNCKEGSKLLNLVMKHLWSNSKFDLLLLLMIAEDFDSEVYDTSLDKFKTYEEYLDSHITKEDLFYLEDIELARQLKE